MKICFMGKGDFCLCKNRSQTFLLQRKTCPAILVIAMELARDSCHCETCRSVLVIAMELAPRFLSLRWSETTEAICLPVDRHTTFAMTIYTTLVMTKKDDHDNQGLSP
jgi:hypothetical protein